MKRKDIEELKIKPVEELRRMLQEGRKRLQTLRFDLKAGKVKDVRELRSLRKDIARILTRIAEADKSGEN